MRCKSKPESVLMFNSNPEGPEEYFCTIGRLSNQTVCAPLIRDDFRVEASYGHAFISLYGFQNTWSMRKDFWEKN